MERIAEKAGSEEFAHILRIQSRALKSMTDYMHGQGLVQVMPVVVSPVTDPLNHEVFDATVDYCGQRLHLTKSMILHKMVYLLGKGQRGIFCISPNVRLEKPECAVSGRHLIEFSQLDIEFAEFRKEEFMRFIEGLVVRVLSDVKADCGKSLDFLGREIKVPEAPFRVLESRLLSSAFGENFEAVASEIICVPFWITDLRREFYDREDRERRGYYHNYDLILPEGFGEVLSGGEREFEHSEIVRKMKERGMDMSAYAEYLKLAERGMLRKSAGGGLGIERLVRFLAGKRSISDVVLFPRAPGEKIVF